MTVRLVLVCTANICRSPLAAAILDAEVRDRGVASLVAVDSAGVHASHGNEAAEPSAAIAGDLGLDLAAHRSRPVDDELDDERTVLLTMTEQHRHLLVTLEPAVASRCFTLREFARLVAAIDLVGLPDAADERVLEVVRRADARRATAGRAAAGRASSRRGSTRRAFPWRAGAWGATSTSGGPEDIADPYGRSDAHYRVMAAIVRELIGEVAPVLLGAPEGEV